MIEEGRSAITRYELGGIRHIEVRLPGRPSVTVASADEGLEEIELISRAERHWEAWDRKEEVAEELRRKHNRQVYIGFLPTHGIETTLSGYYAYVLKDRKHKGRYQILDAVKL